jgi:fatty acid-binding protein DegV
VELPKPGRVKFHQDVDLDSEGFYKLVDETGKIPKTSQPSPHKLEMPSFPSM